MNPGGTKAVLQAKFTLYHLGLIDHDYVEALIKEGVGYWTWNKDLLEVEVAKRGLVLLTSQLKRELVALLLEYKV